MGNFLIRYAPRVVIYDRGVVIRLATGFGTILHTFLASKSKNSILEFRDFERWKYFQKWEEGKERSAISLVPISSRKYFALGVIKHKNPRLNSFNIFWPLSS